MSQPAGSALGFEWKLRGIFEGDEWAESLAAVAISERDWDQRFRFASWNIAVQPLINTRPFLDESKRVIQVSLANELIGWVYFRIEPDDANCTLLWIEARRFSRVG